MLMIAHPPSRSPSARGESTFSLLDVVIMCTTTYLTYTRFPRCWKSVLCHFYLLFITAWAYAETYGLLRADASLGLRCLNVSLCLVNLLMEASEARVRVRLV
jgi:hypothetical protein